MNIYYIINYLKILILFFIFYSGTCNSNNQSYNNTPICKSLKNLQENNYVSFNKKLIYYSCKHRDDNKTRRAYNVLGKNILRKYIYIINVVVIYIILNSL
jgi:hypothetical protein